MADATGLVSSAAGGFGIGAGLAIGLSAIGAGLSQGSLGSAALGIVAERPEFEKNILIYIVLPEILVVFGFLIAILLWLQIGSAA